MIFSDDDAPTDKPAFALPELLHNINMLVDNCEEDLISADRRLRHHRDRVEVLKLEEEKMAKLCQREKQEARYCERPFLQ